jgi:hypothetical protein
MRMIKVTEAFEKFKRLPEEVCTLGTGPSLARLGLGPHYCRIGTTANHLP